MKLHDEIMKILVALNPDCPVCGHPLGGWRNARYHHQLHNAAGNRHKFPLFIDSIHNGLPYHPHCQDNENRFFITEREAGLYEDFFQEYVNYLDGKSDENFVILKFRTLNKEYPVNMVEIDFDLKRIYKIHNKIDV